MSDPSVTPPALKRNGWKKSAVARVTAGLTAGFSLVIFGSVGAQVPAARSLTEGEKPASPSPGTEVVVQTQLAQAQVQIAELHTQVERLKQSLDLADADADTFRRQWQELRLRDQALGIEALTVDEKKLEDRVVEAIKELYQTEQQRRNAVVRLQQLLDAGQDVLKGAQVDPQRRADYEVAVRGAREFLEARGRSEVPVAADLTQGQIVHVNPELNSVILNVGSRMELRPGVPLSAGVPFRVMREDRVIGTLKVFQIRETVCVAVIESLEKGKELKIGDRVAVAAEK